MWDEYELKMTFTTPLCGGVPRSEGIVQRWCQLRSASNAQLARMQESSPVRTLEQVAEERLSTIDPLPADTAEEIARVWVGFSRDEAGLFVRGGNIRAHFKDCAGTLGPIMKRGAVPGLVAMTAFKARATEALYIREDRVHLKQDGQIVTEPTAHREATLSVMTPPGPRTALKRVDYTFPCQLQSTILLLQNGVINRDHLIALLEYGKVHGFGQDRSLGYGKYEYELSD